MKSTWLALVLMLLEAHALAKETLNAFNEPTSDLSLLLKHRNECALLGFDVEALDCRLCDTLASFLAPVAAKAQTNGAKAVQKVTQECHECCSDLSKVLEAEGRRFYKAVLAVNQYRLKRYPKVANFLEHQAKQIKRLEVEEANLRLPMLLFFDKVGEKVEEISVAHWDENSILEFIERKLLPDEEAEEAVVEVEVDAANL
ncbi:hypothetical protein CCR75_008703 [Bremia lactucae]|uniref:Selenoprotein F n=1 Tax=Bremia lactucae TaxID=4779 RepID=A0A976FLV2_BRELC|nr:hypothetical protein CCR75_008703 [Bremia lactucae]